MRDLNTNEKIAVALAVFVVGFFFIFGQTIISAINPNSSVSNQQLQIQDEVVGVGDVAVTGDTLIVNYTGKLPDGTVFDSSIPRNEPFQFRLGAGMVIKGWDEGLQGMKVGGKRILIIPPEYGYGAEGIAGVIPGNSTIIFEIELLKVTK
ncbi:MAG: FKBP-type peptidyl-prolyl cis-trans isomerase [Minisyncoccia bacterium]